MNKYREGKVKRTALSGVKQNLKSCAYNVSEPGFGRVMACLLLNESASYCQWQLKPFRGGGIAKASPKWAFVAGDRPEAEVIYPWSGCSSGNTG